MDDGDEKPPKKVRATSPADGGGAGGSSGASGEGVGEGGGSGAGDACTEGTEGGDAGEGKEGNEGTVGGRRAPLALQLPEGYAIESGKFLPIGSLTAYPSAVRPVVAGDGIPHLILELLLPATLGSLPQSTGVESVRGACRGGWTFIERNLKATFIDAMCSSAAGADLCDLYEKWLKTSPTGAPATGAEKMALCRGLQKKAIMINLVNELQVADVNVDAPLKEWEGVTVGADGQVVEIDFSRRCKGGAYTSIQARAGEEGEMKAR
jgi:hypothetical protein